MADDPRPFPFPERFEGIAMTPELRTAMEIVAFRAYTMGALDASARVLAFAGNEKPQGERILCAQITNAIRDYRNEKIRGARREGSTLFALTGAQL